MATIKENKINEWVNTKSPLDYIEDKFNNEGIEYELDWIDDGDYDVEFTIKDPNNVDRADDIICNEVGMAYEVVRDKFGNKKAFKVATYQDVIDRLNEGADLAHIGEKLQESNEYKVIGTNSEGSEVVFTGTKKECEDYIATVEAEEDELYGDAPDRFEYHIELDEPITYVNYRDYILAQRRKEIAEANKKYIQFTKQDIIENIALKRLSTDFENVLSLQDLKKAITKELDGMKNSLDKSKYELLKGHMEVTPRDLKYYRDFVKNIINHKDSKEVKDDIQELNDSLKGNHSLKGLTKKVVEAKETCSQDYLRYKKQLQKAKSIDELRKVWQTIKKDLDDDMSFEEDKKLSDLFLERKKELNEGLKNDKDTLYLVRTKSGVFEVRAKNGNQALKQARLMQDEPVERVVDTNTNKVVFNLEENLQEGWVQFTFEDGSNPYVAKTKEEQDRMFKKYKDRVEQVSDITYLVKSDKKKTNESFDDAYPNSVKYAVVYRNREDGSLIDAKVYDNYSKASALYQTELAKRDLDPSIEIDIEDVTPESSLWEESLKEDNQVTYVWKRDGDDHILTKKGNNKALITLSRMNSGFPWTIYKGNKEITLDNDSDKLSDIKAYILKNVDKILGNKLKKVNEANDNYFSSKPNNDIKIKKFVKEYADEIKNDIDNDMYDDYGMWSKYLDMFTIDFPKNRLTISEFAIKFFDEINKRFGSDFHYGYVKEGLDDYANKWEKKARDQARGEVVTTKYYVEGYYDDKYRGLANSEVFDDPDKAFEYVWELLQKGNYVKINNFYKLSPDDVQEPEDIPSEWFMENLKEAKGKLDDALPELEKYVNEYKDKLVEYGQALAKGEVARPDYKDFTTRFIFDIYYLFKRRGLNLGKYIDENELQDKYIATLMKKALTNCGVKITKDEYLNESLDTFNDKMDFLAKDEDEAIDGYKKVIKTVDNKNVKAQLKKIETEEKAHKDYLERVKKNKDIKYTEPLDEE